ncbi:MAG: PH domain-containing protein [Candidatus Uhrbacteria bacterium]|nr:PH domain-containing protein [Candidatus Uhrbacteria bacterium]
MLSLKHLPNAIPDEKVIFALRRHYITLFSLITSMIVLIVAPFLIQQYLVRFQPEILGDPTTVAILVIAGSIFFLFAWLFLFQNYIDYDLDMWIVTTKRILNIEQTGLFSRTISELRLYRIQDVTSSVKGFIHMMFDYGHVEIQTAGEQPRFLFEDIPHPNAVAKAILEYAEIDRREHLDEAVEEFAMVDKK